MLGLNPIVAGIVMAGAVVMVGATPRHAAAGDELAGRTIQARNHVMTNVPEVFNGLDVNTFLGADRFYDAGITGQGAIVANVEAGHIWDGHENLTHVSQFAHHPDAWGSSTADLYDRHATWAGGHLGGRNSLTDGAVGAWETGLAPGADLRSGALATQWNGGAYSLSFSINANTFNGAYTPYFGTADVVNSSFGFQDSDANSFFAVALDGYANDSPGTTFVASAGNSNLDPWLDPFNNVGAPAAGYNSIAVAALQNANDFDQVAAFSSRGPQDYSDPVNGVVSEVRSPVDIAAPGTNLTAPYYGGQTGGNDASLVGSPDPPSVTTDPSRYSISVAGTSFSAPIVAGGAALLHSAQANDVVLSTHADADDTRVIKAVLLNAADKVDSTTGQAWDNGQTIVGGVVTTTQSLDYAVGAGRMNLDRAYDQYIAAGTRDVPGPSGATVTGIGWDYGTVTEGASNHYPIGTALVGGTDFTVTLDWFRERSYDPATFDPDDDPDDIAQANLDLFVRDLGTGELVARSISTYNVVEHLHFEIPSTGLYQIEVDYVGDLFDRSGGTHLSEEYGLAWAGTIVPEPATLVLIALGAAMCFKPRRRRAAA